MACKCKDCKCGEMTNEKVIEQMDDQRKPYTERVYASYAFDTLKIRHFDPSAPEHLFKWHWDEEDRWVEAIYENDWKFQFDNELPFELQNGMQIYIECGRYHRIIPGWRPQKLKIIKQNT